jgi:hypothetical protein
LALWGDHTRSGARGLQDQWHSCHRQQTMAALCCSAQAAAGNRSWIAGRRSRAAEKAPRYVGWDKFCCKPQPTSVKRPIQGC